MAKVLKTEISDEVLNELIKIVLNVKSVEG